MKYIAYYRVKFTLSSPMAIGASRSEQTDKDVILNSRGRPMIPASSIAGVYRSLAEEREGLVKDGECNDKVKRNFGYVKIKNDANKKEADEIIASALKFYDAQLMGEASVASRDCVKLDEYKTADGGAKFDFQSVETGAVFIGYIEATTKEAGEYVEEMLERRVSFGAKTTRGYGLVEVAYQVKEFDFAVDGKMEEWLDFDMFGGFDANGQWIRGANSTDESVTTIDLLLRQRGGLSIRQYLTEPKQEDEGKQEQGCDYGPLSLRDGTPVIPGTSWAGMFHHHVSRLLGEDCKGDCENAFGHVEGKNAWKSHIGFSESNLNDFTTKTLVRNAIDRFTNGTKDGALYTEKTVYGGQTKLTITLRNGFKRVKESVVAALLATILDLDGGFVAIGGLTSVGRGLFEVTEIRVNGEECKRGEEMKEWDYGALFEKVKAVMGNE